MRSRAASGALRAWTALRLAVRALRRTRGAAAQRPSTPKASRQLTVAAAAALLLCRALFLVGSVICAGFAVWAPDTWFEDSLAAKLALTAGAAGAVVALPAVGPRRPCWRAASACAP